MNVGAMERSSMNGTGPFGCPPALPGPETDIEGRSGVCNCMGLGRGGETVFGGFD